MEKEIRSFNVEFRTDKDSRTIEGYAAMFDSPSRDMGFVEYIDRGAFDGVIERSDVFAVFNHDNNQVLARSNKGVGSLELTIDDKGLHYRFEAPNTDLGNTVLEFIRRGELSESSFAFTVSNEAWEKESDGTYVRHISGIERLYDVSPVWTAAYPATSVSCRSFEEFKEKERLEAEKQAAEAEQEEERLENERRMKEAEEAAKAEEERLEAEKRAEEEKQAEEEKTRIAEEYARIKEEYKDYLN